ncbi:DUF192 domain-containing protein [Serpentinicella sp. ANB-PHB4]|uniref:DUF192 domain-containing protein n=1 Tax=Serpentinicella sp. ANB-PHB4 TaxID=3074076 RepID=UPI00286740AF|nr:DUF192 domain-containing protein [Serpentinicella sp. ANB-PHB4]MDR5658925.1 DUF192 domain-containing protein [Serpentinicella sp. ANB-PHB4]
MKKNYKIINERNNEIVASKVVLANTFWGRLKGLLGRENLEIGEGIVLYPCNAIHCFGMKFNIDLIFLDKNKKVIKMLKNIKPNERASCKEASYVVELKSGSLTSKEIDMGDTLLLIDNK